MELESTMLKMLARDLLQTGVISQEKDIKMGFLRQDIDLNKEEPF
jgi:ATP-binding cassette subfamily F protein 3